MTDPPPKPAVVLNYAEPGLDQTPTGRIIVRNVEDGVVLIDPPTLQPHALWVSVIVTALVLVGGGLWVLQWWAVVIMAMGSLPLLEGISLSTGKRIEVRDAQLTLTCRSILYRVRKWDCKRIRRFHAAIYVKTPHRNTGTLFLEPHEGWAVPLFERLPERELNKVKSILDVACGLADHPSDPHGTRVKDILGSNLRL